jgi:hypothetical protein
MRLKARKVLARMMAGCRRFAAEAARITGCSVEKEICNDPVATTKM